MGSVAPVVHEPERTRGGGGALILVREGFEWVGLSGLEPLTSALSGRPGERRSSRLRG